MTIIHANRKLTSELIMNVNLSQHRFVSKTQIPMQNTIKITTNIYEFTECLSWITWLQQAAISVL